MFWPFYSTRYYFMEIKMAAVLNILIGVCLLAALAVALKRPKENMEDPEVRAKDDRLRKITGIILFCAVVILAVKLIMFR